MDRGRAVQVLGKPARLHAGDQDGLRGPAGTDGPQGSHRLSEEAHQVIGRVPMAGGTVQASGNEAAYGWLWLMLAADAALEAALQLRLTLGAVLALLVARPIGGLAARRARSLRAHETRRYHEGGQGDREE